MATTSTLSKLTVIVPLFPRHPGLRRAIGSLRAQTRRPDLLVLLDDGEQGDIAPLEREAAGIPLQILQSETSDVAEAINKAVDFLTKSQFIAILCGGAAYAPTRLGRCLAALENPGRTRQIGLALTAMALVDSQGSPMREQDKRRVLLARLWTPGREGVGIPEWLGAGDFVLSASNLFARHSYLKANPLIGGQASLAYHAAIQAAAQSQLEIIDEPLLDYYWAGPESAQSSVAGAALLRSQIALIHALREKLNTSPETRRNFAAFHRAAWNNISGLREDLFAQTALQLASLAPPEEMAKITERLAETGALPEPPSHLRKLRESPAYADPVAYAAALAKTRAELAALREDHKRLTRVAAAAQGSGWVRFGAWLGDHSARRIMEMEEEEKTSVQSPNGKIESRGEHDPDKVRNQKPGSGAADTAESTTGENNGRAKQSDIEQSETGIAQTEKERRP